MKGLCGLGPDINRCPNYIKDKEGCGADHTECGFFRHPEIKKETVTKREPKWFEKYYKR